MWGGTATGFTDLFSTSGTAAAWTGSSDYLSERLISLPEAEIFTGAQISTGDLDL
jgi:hypothetical protein